MHYNDVHFGNTKRHFYIELPTNYNKNTKYPLLMYFLGHGMVGVHDNSIDGGRRLNWITVYPQGMNDEPVYQETGFNVPHKKNDMNMCNRGTNGPCYDSCNKLGLCYTCSWTSCYDDVGFTDALMAHLNDELCID
jgi:hypothetical protein